MNRKIERLAVVLALTLLVTLSSLPAAHSTGNFHYGYWPMYRYDLMHSGGTVSPAPSVANVKWIVETGGDVCSSAAVAYGKLYIGAGCSIQRNVLCLNPRTGAVIWNQTVAGTLCSSPAVEYGRVYVGTNYQSWDPVHSDPSQNPYGNMGVGSVTCLDARTGRIYWSYIVGQYGPPDKVGQYNVISSPAVVGGRVYIGAGDSYVYCFSAFTGSLIWNYSTNGAVDSSPAVCCGKVYVGSSDENVYCLDAGMGEFIWSKELNGSVWCSPTVVNGRVYVGNRGDGVVYCLDAETGDLLWPYPESGSIGSIMSSPAVALGNVYIGTESPDGRLYCVDANTGAFRWKYNTTGDIHHSSPAVSREKVYIGSWGSDHDDPGYTHCVNAITGEFIWKYPSAPHGYHSSSPTIAHCMVFTAGDKFIYGFSGPPTPTIP